VRIGLDPQLAKEFTQLEGHVFAYRDAPIAQSTAAVVVSPRTVRIADAHNPTQEEERVSSANHKNVTNGESTSPREKNEGSDRDGSRRDDRPNPTKRNEMSAPLIDADPSRVQRR